MSSGPRIDRSHRLSVRLTVWYAGMFTVTAAIAFALFFLLITRNARDLTDQDLQRRIRHYATILAIRGAAAAEEAAVLETQAAGETRVFVRFLYPDGRVASSSNMTAWESIPVNRQAIRKLLEGRLVVLESQHVGQPPQRVRVAYGLIGDGLFIQLGDAQTTADTWLARFRWLFVVVMGGLVVAVACIGWFMVRQALVRVERVTRAARWISQGGDLHQRVPVGQTRDEIADLALTFNSMIDRIEVLVTGIREMSDNIAHDLKSPITRIRGLAEVTLLNDSGVDAYRDMAASAIEDSDRLLDLINTMLDISRTEAGVVRPDQISFDFAQLVADAGGLFEPMAADRTVRLSIDPLPVAHVIGDRRMLQRMVANFLDNAIKYTPSNGTVRMGIDATAADRVQFWISDTGPGIPAEDLPRIFDRFFRGDASRSQAGTGLGLSLARAIAEAHGGRVSVSSAPGDGSRFSVDLPGSPPTPESQALKPHRHPASSK